MSRPKQLAHIVLGTRQYQVMIDWWLMFLDADLRFRNDALAFVSFDDEHHRIAFANMDTIGGEGALSPKEGTLRHVAFTFETAGELLENFERIRDAGYRPYWCIHHGMTLSLYYSDPDGNQVEIQVDSFENPDDANAFIGGPQFARNPIGVEFDPEELLARYRAGASEEELLYYDPNGPISPIRRAASHDGSGTSAEVYTMPEEA